MATPLVYTIPGPGGILDLHLFAAAYQPSRLEGGMSTNLLTTIQ